MNNSYNTFDEIAATIAHEIKNPVSLALANMNLIKHMDTEKVYEKYFGIIERELYKINDLANNFVQLSMDTTSFMNKNLSEINIIDIVQKVIDEYKKASVKDVEFILTFPETELKMLCDEQGIGIVFSNLIKNSIEAIEVNPGKIEISAQIENHCVEFKIKDNGVGMTLEQFEKMEMPGYTSKKNGSGIGLGICRGIIQRHNGMLTVESFESGHQGCLVTVRLPI